VITRTRLTRSAAALVIAGSIAFGTSGCIFMTPTGTLEQYDPTDGVQATIGSIAARNVVGIVSDDGASISLIITLVNSGTRGTKVTLQYTSGGEKTNVDKYVGAGETVSFGGTDEEQIILQSADVAAGGLLPVYFQHGDQPGTQMLVPVLEAQGIYADLGPAVSE
jgi:hypothetical protein